MQKKYDIIQWSERWQQAFGNPENSGVFFIWGLSGNGKTSFCMQLLKELATLGPCFYNSLEEGARMTMKEQVQRFQLHEHSANILIGCEEIEELKMRLRKKRAPKYIFIDSWQYTQMSYKDYLLLKKEFPEKLFIIISHAQGSSPEGRPCKAIRFDADLKLHIQGYRAISMGRYNPGGYFDIWPEKAIEYWGTE